MLLLLPSVSVQQLDLNSNNRFYDVCEVPQGVDIQQHALYLVSKTYPNYTITP